MVVLVLMPFAAFVAVAGMELAQVSGRLAAARQLKTDSDFFAAVSHLIHEAQAERGLTGLYLNGKAEKSTVTEQRDRVDKARGELESLLKSGRTMEPVVTGVRKALDQLQDVRHRADEKCPAKEAVGVYIEFVLALIGHQADAAKRVKLDGLDSRMISLVILEQAKDGMGRLRALGANLIAADQPLAISAIGEIETFRSGIIANLNSPVLKLTDAGFEKLNAAQGSSEWRGLFEAIGVLMQKSAEGRFGISSKDYFATATSAIDKIGAIVKSEVGDLNRIALETERRALIVFYGTVGGIAVFSVVLAVFAVAMIRVMARAFASVAGKLAGGAESISNSASRMFKIGEELSRSTGDQVALAQKTVAAVQQVSAMVDRNASHAKTSEEKANEGSAAAEQGKESVLQVITSIQEIQIANDEIGAQVENSNRELSEIVKIINEIGAKTNIINDIVFQTKLLSFNASVEAARAGDQGKGFAVVAEEVGSLAQVSGAAASEISKMLAEGTQRVESIVSMSRSNVESLLAVAKEKIERGTTISQKCGEIIDQLHQNVAEVSSMAAEVARASEEQSKGIQEISQAMVELDRSNHDNKRISDEVHASTEGLNSEVIGLRESTDVLLTIVNGDDSHKAS
jgi:methyl-accepting chemotaxis protein